jgi:uncharacterized protein (DUF58 family)
VTTVLAALPGGRANPEGLLRSLELVITRRLDGLLQGDHRGLLPGPGSEAGESRTYEPGDDVRRIDWPLSARSGTTHVRNTVADRELETWVVVDGSASMEFGTADCTKRDLALAAVAAIGFLTTRDGNRIGVALLDGDRVRIVPARTGRQALLALLHAVAVRDRAPDGTTVDLARGTRSLLGLGRRGGLAVVVSDFLGQGDWDRALRAVALRHQVLAIEVVDPRELELPDVGFLSLVDPESGQVREVQTSRGDLRARYSAAATAEREAHARAIRRAGASHLTLRTDRDWVADIASFVRASRRTAASKAASR